MYGQIVLGDEEYRIAADSLEFWYANTTTERQPAVIFSLGYANYMIENLPRAEEVIYEAIGLSAEPKESWYRLYYQILFDQRKFAAAEDVLLGMITRNPLKSAHWRLLANHHLQLEDGQKALAAIAIAYQNGWLESEQDLRRMIALYSVIDVPEKAARLMETHLADASIEKDADTLKRLGNLWLLAREREKAKGVLEEAADVSPDGRTYEMLGNIYFEDESWRDAHQAFINAIDSGGLDDVERVYLLAGISAERGGMKKEARAALRKARESEDLRKQADALLKRLDSS
jgi:tetratricopeptide (TPR) repeat protein